MKIQIGLAGVLASAFMAFASTSASAGIIDFTFSNTGAVDSATSCGFNCLLVKTSGTATETGGIAGSNSWNFDGTMKFSSLGGFAVEGNGSGTGLGWSFTDTSGNDNLWGSFSSDLTSLYG